MYKKSIFLLLSIILIGCIIGTALSMLIGFIMPDGVVKDFLFYLIHLALDIVQTIGLILDHLDLN